MPPGRLTTTLRGPKTIGSPRAMTNPDRTHSQITQRGHRPIMNVRRPIRGQMRMSTLTRNQTTRHARQRTMSVRLPIREQTRTNAPLRVHGLTRTSGLNRMRGLNLRRNRTIHGQNPSRASRRSHVSSQNQDNNLNRGLRQNHDNNRINRLSRSPARRPSLGAEVRRHNNHTTSAPRSRTTMATIRMGNRRSSDEEQIAGFC